jgi:hypothetical protein
VTDQWVPGPPPVAAPPIAPGLPLADQWNPAAACYSAECTLSFVGNIMLNCAAGSSISYAANGALIWQVALNDGNSPPGFAIQFYGGASAPQAVPISIDGGSTNYVTFGTAAFFGAAQFDGNVFVPGTIMLPDATHLNVPGGTAGQVLTALGIGGFVDWQTPTAPPIATDAPSNGNLYGRVNGAWSSGGVFAAPVYFQGMNVAALVGAAGTQRSLLGGTGTAPTPVSWRWQMVLGDQTAEAGANSGSNFSLIPISDTGASATPALSISRASGAATFGYTVTVPGLAGNVPSLLINKALSGSVSALAGQTNGSARWQLALGDYGAELGNSLGSNFRLDRFTDAGAINGTSPLLIARNSGAATFGYGVTVNGVLSLAGPANLSIGGGAADEVLTTDGAGNLFWSEVTGGGAGGVDEAPIDGNLYARGDAGWRSGGVFTQPLTVGGPSFSVVNPTGNTVVCSAYGANADSSNPAALELDIYPDGVNWGAGIGLYPINGVNASGGYQFWVQPNVGAAQVQLLCDAASSCSVVGGKALTSRWQITLPDATPETGANNGSNFSIESFTDTGAPLSTPLTINRTAGNVAVNGNGVTVFPTPPVVGTAAFGVNKPAGAFGNQFNGYANGVMRWRLNFGNATVETGGNTGSDFSITSFTDAGAVLLTPLSISRATGDVTFAALPSFPGGANGQALTTNGAGVLAWSGPYAPAVGGAYLPLVGGTLTGYLALDGTPANRAIAGQTGGAMRWAIYPGDGAVEGGLNTGSNFTIQNYSDAGISIGPPPFSINRATGVATFGGAVNANGGITGVVNGSNAAPGQIGEVISVVASSTTLLSTIAPTNVASITLTPGDWDVHGDAWFTIGDQATVSVVHAAVTPNSATLPPNNSPALNLARTSTPPVDGLTPGGSPSFSVRTCRANVTIATPYYLVVAAGITAGNVTANGAIWARRAR